MTDLLLKSNLSKDELEKLDLYFDDDNVCKLLGFNNEIIIRFIEACEETLGYSLTKIDLEYYLSTEASDAKLFFEEDKIDYYNKILELIKHFSFTDWGLSYTIGDHFYYENNKEEALRYYSKIFKNGFNLCNENYFDSLVKYLKLLNINPSEKLKELIKSSPRDDDYSLDFIDTYLLLIINLEKFSDEYFYYINEGIKIAIPVVREHQKYTKNRSSFSDTDEERDLCELLALKQEYYVEKKEYIKAFEMYNELTYEIGRSDCTRYYHAREKYYRQMLKYMSEDHPELKFFEDIGYYKFKVLDNCKKFKLNQEITLKKEDGMTFNFKVVKIFEDTDITIVPILPILGEGARIFTNLEIENENVYLVNKLSN